MYLRGIDFCTTLVGVNATGLPVYTVEVPKPPFGARGYMIEEKGIYVLSRAPSVVNTIACTHVGAGAVRVLDTKLDGLMVPKDAKQLYKANPQTMCLWMLGAGAEQGIVVEAVGGTNGTPVFVSVSWAGGD